MWTHVLANSCQLAQLLDDVENHHSCEAVATAVKEEDVLAATFYHLVAARLLQVKVDLPQCFLRDGDEALLVALAHYYYVFLLSKDLRKSQLHQLAHTQPAAVEHLNDGAVALPLWVAQVDAGNHLVDFGNGEYLGQVLSQAWRG